MLVMEVIVRLQDRALCASITCITGTYAEPEGPVIFDHRHNADVRANWWQIAELWPPSPGDGDHRTPRGPP
jgi:hypothetical protein